MTVQIRMGRRYVLTTGYHTEILTPVATSGGGGLLKGERQNQYRVVEGMVYVALTRDTVGRRVGKVSRVLKEKTE